MSAAAATRYDRRVTAEARALLKAARGLTSSWARSSERVDADTKTLRGEVATASAAMQQAVDGGDHGAIKRLLPRLDAAVDRAAGTESSVGREYTESIAWAIVIALLLRGFVVEAFKIPSASMIPTMQIGDFIFVNKLVYGVRVPYTRTKLFDVRGPKRGEVVVFMNPCTPEKDFIKRAVAIAGDTVEVRCSVLYVNGQAVADSLIDQPCLYWDQDEGTGRWSQVDSCSAYQAHLGDQSFTTYYYEDRPQGGPHVGPHDFPNQRDLDMNRARGSNFRCDRGDERSPAERQRSEGQIVSSLPPGQEPASECALQMHYVVPPGHFFAMGDNRDNSNDSRGWGPVPLENLKGKAMFIWLSKGPDASWIPPFGLRWKRMGNFVHD